jgi:signal transduction histidine kinase
VLTTIVEQTVSLLKPDEVHIYLYDGVSLSFGAAYWDGQPQQAPLRVPRAEGFTERIAHAGERQVIPDLQRDEIFNIRSWTGAVVGVPLSVGAKVYGVMNVGYAQPHDYGVNELHIIQLLADQAAIAIRNAREYGLARDYAAELEVRVAERTAELVRAKETAEALVLGQRKVLALTYELISSPDIDSLWKRAVEMARSVLGVERCSIFIERDNFMCGTYGTSLQGETTDEHLARFFKGERSWENLESVLALDMPAWGMEYNPRQEWDGEKWIDLPPGWVAVTPIHSAYRFIGIFYNDAGISGAPVNETQQEILSMYCSFLGSLYEHKRVEDEVRRALEREKELSELKSRFTSMISHELRTPLSTIQLSGDLLKRYSIRLSEDAINAHIDKIQAQVAHLTNLLEDVLTFTRGDGAGLQLQVRSIDLKAFCAELGTEVGLMHTSHIVTFEDCPGTWVGTVDPKLLRQALLNLLLNAIKYSPEHSRVMLSLERDGSDAVIRVSDNGIGIPETDLPHIFDVFYRARNVGAISGTGLGLALVHQIAEAHHGFVVCESQVGVGTTFTLRIPAF